MLLTGVDIHSSYRFVLFMMSTASDKQMLSETKATLKEARELLKRSEYVEAIKRCKEILKKDKDNYAALVLMGAAMREVKELKHQAIIALERATEINPSNPVAWQGLVTCYEKESKDHSVLSKQAMAYCKLLQLDSNSPKFSYFLNKLCDLSSYLKSKKVLAQIIETLDQLRKIEDQEKIKLIDRSLVSILMEDINSATINQVLFETALQSVIQDVDVVNRQDYYRKYLQILYNCGKLSDMLKEAQKMHQQFPYDIYPLERICCVYYEENILKGNFIDVNITQYYETLLEIDTDSQSGVLAKAVYLKNTNDIISAREVLNQLLVSKSQSFYVWVTLSEIQIKLSCWEDAEFAARQALQVAKPDRADNVLYRVQLTLIESMSRNNSRQKWESARKMSERLLKEQFSVQLQLLHARTSVLLDDPDLCNELNLLESHLEIKVEVNILRALHWINHKQLEEAENALISASEFSEAWLLLGKIYWEKEEYNRSLTAFLNGVKVDRHNWECLVYLGRYYREYGNDIERSRRCYQSALQINPKSEEAGIGLSTAYRLLKKQDANMHLLQRLTMQDRGPKWAWLQLGLQYLDGGDQVQAITAFQYVIRADPNYNYSWECLADAYLTRGAYTSALKSYQRALELRPGSLYPMIQVANIKAIIGHHNEAKEDFEGILLKSPRYVPALKGLAETCLGLAKENIAKQFLGRARDNIQQAVDNLTVALMERNNLSCIWKLFGDACYQVALMSEKYSYLKVISALMKMNIMTEYVTIKRSEVFLLCARCYCRALSLFPNSALIWHDLACCYLRQLQLESLVDQASLAKRCLAAGKQAVKLCPTSWLHWNLLGVICMTPCIKNYALAQHAYVMAIDRELNNAVVWSNLGTLYLYIGNLYKANEAYSRAQRTFPAYINSWIGQGLIAEQMKRKEAMDLFGHSTQLGYHNQAAVGYAHGVLSILLTSGAKKDPLYAYMLQNMHAMSVATDVISWYIEHRPDDCYARNAQGLLLERQKLYTSAAEAFTAALRLSTNKQKDFVCINLARVLIHLKRYHEAVKLCRAVNEINFQSQCQLALSLFKAEEYEESYAAYETALHSLAHTGLEKANALCAMAAMAYIFQGVDDVKTLLFQCIQIQPPVVAGFLAAASLGILHGDLNLAKLVLKELKFYEDDEEYGHHVANLSAYSHIIQNNVSSAIVVLSKAIHRHPDDARYWMRLLRILFETDLDTFGKCTQKVLFLSKSIAGINVLPVACVSTLNKVRQCVGNEGIRSAQKILFKYPGHFETSVSFIAALLQRGVHEESKPNARWLSTFISITEKICEPKSRAADWLNHNYRKINAIMEQTARIH